jgi:hypothetical protein
MTFDRYDSKSLQQYREKVAKLSELRKAVGDQLGKLAPSEAERVFDELTLRTREMESLGGSLGKDGVLLAKYGVEVINSHTVSFVLPKGCSRIEILHEVQELIRDRDGRNLVNPEWLAVWGESPRFASRIASSELFRIDGHVEGGDGRTREEQESLVTAKGFTLPSLEDLAVAFALNWVATGEPLISRGSPHNDCYIRASFGALVFYHSAGLNEPHRRDGILWEVGNSSGRFIAVSARLSPADT